MPASVAETPDLVRIVVADDHPVVRDGTCVLIEAEKDLSVVATAATAREAIRLVTEITPDVLLLDVVLPDQSGIDVARYLVERSFSTRIIAFSAYESPSFIAGCRAVGMSGYITKDVSRTEVVEAIRGVARGEYRWPVHTPPLREEGANVSDRELSILAYLVSGMANKQIARELSISGQTVKNHLSNLYAKLGVHSAREAVAKALEDGIVAYGGRSSDA